MNQTVKKQMKKWTNKQINKIMNAHKPHTIYIDHFLFGFWVEKKITWSKAAIKGKQERERKKRTQN